MYIAFRKLKPVIFFRNSASRNLFYKGIDNSIYYTTYRLYICKNLEIC